MVLCCCEPVEALTPEDWGNAQKQNEGGYPGQRRQFTRTNGNALIAAVPVNGGHEGEDLVSVTVPEGIAPGQTIAVMAPDGSRLVKATIPPGLNPGDTFLVRLAHPIQSDVLNAQPVLPSQPSQPNFADALDNWLTPTREVAAPVQDDARDSWLTPTREAAAPVQDYGKIDKSIAEAVATPIHETNSPARPPPAFQHVSGQPVHAKVERAEARQDRDVRNPSPMTSSPQVSVPTSPSNQRLLLVHVPPGMPAGATLQVEVPGENRTIAAQIPPGAQSFHVAYTPLPQQMRSQPPPLQAPSTVVPQRPQSPVGQKLLLVRVPPGTMPGTTLHVSVPDEPGRILAAQVPPGNVQEFHVSYEARPQHSPSRAGMLPPANAYASGTNAPQFYTNNGPPVKNNGYHQQAAPTNDYYPQQQRMTPNSNDNYNRNDGGGGGNFLWPFLGGAAFGAAGAATYDHFANSNNNNNNNDGDNYTGDDTADYGGDDYGGGFDF